MYSKRQLSNIIYFLEDARSCLRVGDNLSDLLQSIVKLFRTKASFQSAALVLLGDGKRVAGTACWSEDPYLPESVLYQWFAASEDVLGSCLEKGGILTDESAARCLPAADPSKLDLLVVPVLLDKTTLGAIFLIKARKSLLGQLLIANMAGCLAFCWVCFLLKK